MLYGESKRYYIERRVAERMVAGRDFAVPCLYRAAAQRHPARRSSSSTASPSTRPTFIARSISSAASAARSCRKSSATAAGRSRPHLVGALLDRRRALFDRHLAAGELAAGRRLQHRDRRIGHRHSRARRGGGRLLRRARPVAAARRPASTTISRPTASRWQIIKDLRESVNFTPVNLMDATAMARQGSFDVIFCRNVLIYFDDASRQAAVAQSLHRADAAAASSASATLSPWPASRTASRSGASTMPSSISGRSSDGRAPRAVPHRRARARAAGVRRPPGA